jgi:hypothetical protein
MQTLSLGLLGEIIIFTHARNIREYQVAEVLRGGNAGPRPVGDGMNSMDEGRRLDGALQAS